jgi:putative transcriptional regulator
VDADERVLFATPIEQRWNAAARLLGIDLLALSSDAGHA